MFGNWKQKYEAEQVAHLETTEFMDTMVAGLTAEQHRLVAKHQEEFEHLRENFKQSMALKEHLWELEKERLKGMADANRDKADLYDSMVKPFAWEWNGSVEINPGKKVDALMARRDDPHQSWRLPYPEGRRP